MVQIATLSDALRCRKAMLACTDHDIAEACSCTRQAATRWIQDSVPSGIYLKPIAKFLALPLNRVVELHAAQVVRRKDGRRKSHA